MKLSSKILSTMIVVLVSLKIFGAQSKKPQLKYPQRHLVFQVGGTGEKPWKFKASYVPKVNFQSAIFTQLLYFDNSYNIYPGLFKSYSWDEKTSSYTFEVDKNFKFSDSRPLKVQDIEFALVKSLLTTNLKLKDRFRSGIYSNILGTEKLKPGMKYKTGICPGIKIINSNKIRIHLKVRNEFFLYFLGVLIPGVAPIEDFEKDYFSYKKWPRGTGNYKVSWSDPYSSLIRLERKVVNRDVLEKSSYPLSVDMYIHGSAIKNGANLTAGSGNTGTGKNIEYKRVIGRTPVAVDIIDFHYGNYLGRNQLFRKAISLATNREAVFKTYPATKASHEIVPSGYYGRSGLVYEYNPKKSMEIVKKYFSTASSPGKPIKALYHGRKNQKMKSYIKVLAEQYRKVGIYVDFEASEDLSFNIKNRNIVFGVQAMVTSYIDPISPFTTYLTDKNMKYHANQKDQKAIRIYREAKEASNKIDRAKSLARLSKHFQENFTLIPVGEMYPSYTHTSKVVSVDLNNVSYTINFDKVVMRN